MGNKVDFAAIFRDITRRVALFEEASIHISKMAAIKVALKEIHKRKKKGWVIYTLLRALCSPSNTRKSLDIKLEYDILGEV